MNIEIGDLIHYKSTLLDYILKVTKVYTPFGDIPITDLELVEIKVGDGARIGETFNEISIYPEKFTLIEKPHNRNGANI